LSRFDEPMPKRQAAALAVLADQISEGGQAKYEYLRGVFSLLGDKWAIIILLVLESGELRHAALRRSLDEALHFEKISQRMLTLKLRAFENKGMVLRIVSDDAPPRVAYRLTEEGKRIAQQVFNMIRALDYK